MIQQGITKEALIKFIENSLDEKNEVALITTQLCGNLKAHGKKKGIKEIGFSINNNFFKNEESISDLLESKVLCVLIVKKKNLSEDFLQQVEEHYCKEHNKKEDK